MQFLRKGRSHHLISGAAEITYEIPVAFHRVAFNQDEGHYLEQVQPLKIPTKVYGPVYKRAERIYNTFLSRPASTGVLLHGEKGGGKTMLANKLCLMAVNDGIPVIIADSGSNIPSPNFATFLASLDFRLVCLFDEFEKCFEKVDHQSSLLPVLDGLATSQRMMIFTSNDINRISSFMIDRPGRIYYNFSYDSLDLETVAAYCADRAIPEHEVENIVRHIKIFQNISFDSLKAVTEEMLRYEMSFDEAMKDLNMCSIDSSGSRWEVLLLTQAGPKKVNEIGMFLFNRTHNIYINEDEFQILKRNDKDVAEDASLEKILEIFQSMPRDRDNETDPISFELDPKKLIKIDDDGMLVYEVLEGIRLGVRVKKKALTKNSM